MIRLSHQHHFYKTCCSYWFLLSVFVMVLSGCQNTLKNKSVVYNTDFDLNTLYAEQSIIGTTPIKPAWSPNSNHVAFLWNDKGYPFRDVWVYSPNSGEKKRLTHQAQSSELPSNLSGITEVLWLNNNDVLYTLNGQLYVLSENGSSSHIEQDKKGIRAVKVSPDGLYISFVYQGAMYLRSADINLDDSRIVVETGHEKAYFQSYQWARNSQSIVFQVTHSHYLPERDIYYYADGGLQKNHVQRAFPGQSTSRFVVGAVNIKQAKVRWFDRSDERDYVWGYGLSGDGKSLFVNSSDPLVKQHSVVVYDVESGKSHTYYQEYDAKHLRPDWQVQWAPGDNGLIILTDKDGFLHLYHKSHKDSEPVALTSGQWEIKQFTVDHINNAVYFIANKSFVSDRQIYRVDIKNRDIERVSEDKPGSHQLLLSPNAALATTLFSNDETPLELLLIDLNTNETTQVTQSPLPSFYQYDWADIGYVHFDSHIDGTPLVGRLSVPADYDSSKSYPLIVGSVYSDSVQNQYGGRTAHPTWGLDQYLVAQGYVVLNVNVRGSWGQGRQHNQGLRHSYGVIDIEDLHSGVQYLVSKGMVDPDRVGIWGSSYGGLMSMMSLFKKPGVYAAGIAGAPATNVAHAYPGQMWVMGEPSGDDQPQRYRNQSALYHTDGLEDPLMIIHGSKDQVVLYSDTIAVIEKLIAKQKMFELVTLPGTGHGWDNEGNAVRLFSFKKMVEFFNRHIRDH